MTVNNQEFSVNYWPGDSHSPMFGGNSNWRGPIWLATTFLLIESLQRFYQYYGDSFTIECPTGSGTMMNLAQIADEIQKRVIKIFARDDEGRRAYNGGNDRLDHDPHFRDHILFYEYFHADNAKGIGASHQTGWTGLVAWMIWQSGRNIPVPQTPKSAAAHYFDEHVPPTPGGSEYGDSLSMFSNYSAYAPSEPANLEPDEL
ncbi:hypothetical protein BT69DRAFT_1335708 [Atractiella rhizophila]|nr:hypothetical protein BT69DRAFT_1335708 [Atractiella rhizophila]